MNTSTTRGSSGARRRLRRWALPAALLAWAGAAWGQDCELATSPLAFGTYDPVDRTVPLDSSTQFIVDCRRPNHVWFTATLSPGNAGSYLPARALRFGSSVLPYNLYRDSARTIVFGDGTGGTQAAVCQTGSSVNGCVGSDPPGPFRRATVPVYGRIPPGADVAAGLHADTIIVTVTF